MVDGRIAFDELGGGRLGRSCAQEKSRQRLVEERQLEAEGKAERGVPKNSWSIRLRLSVEVRGAACGGKGDSISPSGLLFPKGGDSWDITHAD